MIIDLGVVLLVLLFTVLGIYQGLVPQLFRIGALVLIWLTVKHLGMVFSIVFRPFGLPGLTGFYLGAIIGAVVLYGTLSLLGRYLSDRFINTRTRRMELHSTLGGYLGFIKGLLVAVVVLLILGALPAGYLEKRPKLQAQVGSSWTIWLTNWINPIPKLTFFDDLSAYQKLLENPEAVERLKEQPAFQELRQHPAVQEALADPEVARKLAEQDYRFLLAEPKVAGLLRDREVRRLLVQLNPREALEAAPAPEPVEVEPAEGPPGVLEPEPWAPGETEEELVPPEEGGEPEGVPGEGSIPVLEPETPSE